MADDYQEVRSGVLFLQDRQDAIRKEIAGHDAFLEKEKTDLPVIEKQQAVESQLAIINSGYDQILEWNKEIQEGEKRLTEELNPGKAAAEGNLASARAARTQAWNALQAAEAALAQAGIPAIREEITALTAESGNVKLAHDRIVNHKSAWEAYNKETEAIRVAEKALSDKKAAREILAKEVGELQGKAEHARLVYEIESKAADNAVTELRSRLTVGCVCPVCMQEIKSALPTDREIAERLRPLLEAKETARLNHEARKQKLDTLDATILAEAHQLEQRKAAHQADNTVSNWQKAVVAALHACGIQVYDAGTDPWLVERLGVINARLTRLSALDQQGRELDKTAQEARVKNAKAAKALEEAQEAFAAAEKLAMDANAELNKTKALKEARKKDVMAAVDAVNAIVKVTRWGANWLNRRDEFRGELSEAVALHEDTIRKRDVLLTEGGEVSSSLKSVSAVLKELEGMIPAWKELEALPARELFLAEDTVQGLKDRLLVERQNEKIARDAAREAEAKVTAFLEANAQYDKASLEHLSGYSQAEIEGLERNQKEVEQALVATRAAMETLVKQAGEHTAKKPAFEEGETLESLKGKETDCDNEILKLNSDATLLEQELKTDVENAEKVGDLAAKAEALREVWVKWDRLNDLVGDNTGKKFRKIAQSYVLGSLVTAANHYMHELTDRYALKVVPGTFIISVEDAYQGFASRPASTISGGESFLVSLSLALALSDIGDSLSVDTLFIDEGFGTLSGAPLQNAVNTLKSLRTKAGRHVGIISHIEELQEKIPVRIQVEKSGKTSSSSVTVVGES